MASVRVDGRCLRRWWVGPRMRLTLADLALGRLRKKLPELREALEGRVQSQQRVLLKPILAHIHFIEATLEQLPGELEERLHPFDEAMMVLISIPGIQAPAATAILAEIGEE